jgi:hypothetical protein
MAKMGRRQYPYLRMMSNKFNKHISWTEFHLLERIPALTAVDYFQPKKFNLLLIDILFVNPADCP